MVVELVAEGGVVDDVDDCVGSEEGLEVGVVETEVLLEAAAVDGSSSLELLSPLESLSPLEPPLPEPSSTAT